MTKIDHYDTIRECIDEFGIFGTVIWLHGYKFGSKFEWILQDGHLLTYIGRNMEVLDTRKIAYHGRFIGYKWADS
jgi:hypothetical protein